MTKNVKTFVLRTDLAHPSFPPLKRRRRREKKKKHFVVSARSLHSFSSRLCRQFVRENEWREEEKRRRRSLCACVCVWLRRARLFPLLLLLYLSPLLFLGSSVSPPSPPPFFSLPRGGWRAKK